MPLIKIARSFSLSLHAAGSTTTAAAPSPLTPAYISRNQPASQHADDAMVRQAVVFYQLIQNVFASRLLLRHRGCLFSTGCLVVVVVVSATTAFPAIAADSRVPFCGSITNAASRCGYLKLPTTSITTCLVVHCQAIIERKIPV